MSARVGAGGGREARVAEAFVDLADTLVGDFDVIDLLDRLAGLSVELLAAESAGILLIDVHGSLRLVASTDEESEWTELLQLQSDDGPCVDCVRSGEPVVVEDLSRVGERWPRFGAALAARPAFGSVHALPLRLRGSAIGSLNLFHPASGRLPAADIALGQSLADIATIGILQERVARRGDVLDEQLRTALNGRVVIEQAKGVLAQRGGLVMDAAFDLMRGYARLRGLRLLDVARQVVEGGLAELVLEAGDAPFGTQAR